MCIKACILVLLLTLQVVTVVAQTGCSVDKKWVHPAYGGSCADYLPNGKFEKWKCKDKRVTQYCCVSCDDAALPASGEGSVESGESASEEATVCVPDPDWVHPEFLDNCADYQLGGVSAQYACDAEAAANCCTCPTASLSSSVSSSACVDLTVMGVEWHDAGGEAFTCAKNYISLAVCDTDGDQYAWQGITGNMACCLCGGGIKTQTPPSKLAVTVTTANKTPTIQPPTPSLPACGCAASWIAGAKTFYGCPHNISSLSFDYCVPDLTGPKCAYETFSDGFKYVQCLYQGNKPKGMRCNADSDCQSNLCLPKPTGRLLTNMTDKQVAAIDRSTYCQTCIGGGSAPCKADSPCQTADHCQGMLCVGDESVGKKCTTCSSGSAAPPCNVNSVCTQDADCKNKRCVLTNQTISALKEISSFVTYPVLKCEACSDGSAPPCKDGDKCSNDTQCKGKICASGNQGYSVCMSCSDGSAAPCKPGSVCTTDAQCIGGFCDATDSAKGKVLTISSFDSHCGGCSDGTAYPCSVGNICSTHSQCKSGLCIGSVGDGYFCRGCSDGSPPPCVDNSECYWNGMCQSGLCYPTGFGETDMWVCASCNDGSKPPCKTPGDPCMADSNCVGAQCYFDPNDKALPVCAIPYCACQASWNVEELYIGAPKGDQRGCVNNFEQWCPAVKTGACNFIADTSLGIDWVPCTQGDTFAEGYYDGLLDSSSHNYYDNTNYDYSNYVDYNFDPCSGHSDCNKGQYCDKSNNCFICDTMFNPSWLAYYSDPSDACDSMDGCCSAGFVSNCPGYFTCDKIKTVAPTKLPTKPPTTKPPTSASPVASANGCTDKKTSLGLVWHDDGGPAYSCAAWYSKWPVKCGEDGDQYAWSGMTANQACCACGGGDETAAGKVAGGGGAAAGGGNGGTCKDVMIGLVPWHDDGGAAYDCVYYAAGDKCVSEGSLYAWGDHTATTACCACGGGVKKASTTDAAAASGTAVGVLGTYANMKVLKGGFVLHWTADNAKKVIDVAVTTGQTNGWIGVGFSPDGSMAGSDVIVGWFDEGSGAGVFGDWHIQNQSPAGFKNTNYNELSKLSIFKVNGMMAITFSRPFNPKQSVHIVPNEITNIIYAFGPARSTCNYSPFCNHATLDRYSQKIFFTVTGFIDSKAANRAVSGDACDGPYKVVCATDLYCRHQGAVNEFIVDYTQTGVCVNVTDLGGTEGTVDSQTVQRVFTNDGGFANKMILNSGFVLLWTVDTVRKSVSVALVSTNPLRQGWISLGFTPTGAMAGSDAVIGWSDGNANEYVGDYFLREQIGDGIVEANRQKLSNKRVIRANGQTAIAFERPLVTEFSVTILGGKIPIIYAAGPMPALDRVMKYHMFRASDTVAFFSNPGATTASLNAAGLHERCGTDYPNCHTGLTCNPYATSPALSLNSYVARGVCMTDREIQGKVSNTAVEISSIVNPALYDNHLRLEKPPRRMTIHWSIVNNSTLKVALVGGWGDNYLAFGFSPYGGMIGSYAVVGWASTNNTQFSEYYLGGKYPWMISKVKNSQVANYEIKREDGQVAMLFTRPLKPSVGVELTPGDFNVVYAFGEVPVNNGDLFGYHRYRNSATINFFKKY